MLPPLAIYLGLAVVIAAVLVLLTGILSPAQPSAAKSRPYESGVSEPVSTQTRWPVRFALVGMLFLIFDVETLFFYPWAVVLREMGWSGILAVLSFFVVLGVGYVYARSRGALEWRWGSDQKSGAPGFILSRLEDWARESSMWPVTFGLACCAIEMMAASASRFDMARFGSEVFRASPRQADLMIVAGRVSQKMAPVLREVYDQMPEPKWVIAMGDCASCSGVFNNYALIQGVDKIVPVDIYVPGCPPTPDALLDSLIKLKARVGLDSRAARHGLQTWARLGVAREEPLEA